MKPIIELYHNGFKVYCKKRDMKLVMDTLRGGWHEAS